MTHFSAVEARSLWALALVGLFLGVHCIAVRFLHIDCIGVSVVASILASIIRGPSVQQVHWYLDVVVCGVWCIGGIVLWPLLLWLWLLWSLLVLLGASSPSSRSELILVLPKCVVEPSQIGDSSSGSDEFDHLSSFGDVDRPGLVFIVVLWDGNSDNFF
jgi:hypothetical protein